MAEAFILIVEGDDPICESIANALQRDGHKCVQAANGAEALMHLRSSRFDLIVWNADIPNGPGSQALPHTGETPDPPVIFLLSLQRPDSVLDAIAQGVVEVITKPVDDFLLRAAVARARARQRLERETLQLRSALARAVGRTGAPRSAAVDADWPTLRALEARYVAHVLAKTEGNKTLAASILGVDRRTLQRLFARGEREK